MGSQDGELPRGCGTRGTPAFVGVTPSASRRCHSSSRAIGRHGCPRGSSPSGHGGRRGLGLCGSQELLRPVCARTGVYQRTTAGTPGSRCARSGPPSVVPTRGAGDAHRICLSAGAGSGAGSARAHPVPRQRTTARVATWPGRRGVGRDARAPQWHARSPGARSHVGVPRTEPADRVRHSTTPASARGGRARIGGAPRRLGCRPRLREPGGASCVLACTAATLRTSGKLPAGGRRDSGRTCSRIGSHPSSDRGLVALGTWHAATVR